MQASHRTDVPKVVFVTPHFYPSVGGLAHYVREIATGLQCLGWQASVITAAAPTDRRMTVEDLGGVRVYRLPRLATLSNTPVNPAWYRDIKHILEIEQPDIVNAHAPVPFIADVAAAATSRRTPFVLTYHAGSMRKHRWLPDLGIRAYEGAVLNLMLSRASRVVCSSEFVRQGVMRRAHAKALTITPGVNTTLFKPAARPTSDSQRILFIGGYANVYPLKGLDYLISAVKGLPDAQLRVIGEPCQSDVANVSYIGFKHGAELVREIQAASVLALPSVTEAESFGMVLIEAMACKVPVVASAIGGIPLVVEDGVDGLIVPARNATALGDALSRVLTDQGFARSMGERGFAKVHRSYTWQQKVEQTAQTFAGLLA